MRRVLIMTVALLAVMALAVPAGAAGHNEGATQLRGLGAFDAAGECDNPAYADADFPIVLTGDFTGCVYQYFEDGRFRPSGTYIERGYEIFDVCLADGTCGTFETTYVFTAKYEDPANFAGQLWGRCQHPIVAGTGTGGFTGVTGRLDFKDDVEAGNFAMRGHISLP